MPPLACSISPARAAAAPVNAPRAWPNSSFSSSESVSAAQFSATNALLGAGAAGVDRARDELLARAGLAGDEHRAGAPPPRGRSAPSPSRIGSLSPTSASSGLLTRICRCSRSTWRASCRRSAADLTRISSSSRKNGFCTKSTAPSFIASTAVSMVPNPVITMNAESTRASRSRCSTSSPEMPGIRMSDRMTSKAFPFAAVTPSSPDWPPFPRNSRRHAACAPCCRARRGRRRSPVCGARG